MADDIRNTDDGIQHGIDDNPNNDATKGGVLGAVGGAVVGAAAGGPIGAVIGAVAGGLASAAGVAAVDRVDNDNNISGVGSGARADIDETLDRDDDTVYVNNAGHNVSTPAYTGTTGSMGAYDNTLTPGNGVPGVQTGGRDADGGMDSRGILEKTADTLTGDHFDDKRGVPTDGALGTTYNTTGTAGVYNDPDGNKGVNRMEGLGETTPSIKTGGYANDGTPDTRGIGEKTVDALTGDDIDDKTGKRVNHP
jgi:hypothetical protein